MRSGIGGIRMKSANTASTVHILYSLVTKKVERNQNIQTDNWLESRPQKKSKMKMRPSCTATLSSPNVLVAASFWEKKSCGRQRLRAQHRSGETGWKKKRALTSDLSSRVCRLAANPPVHSEFSFLSPV